MEFINVFAQLIHQSRVNKKKMGFPFGLEQTSIELAFWFASISYSFMIPPSATSPPQKPTQKSIIKLCSAFFLPTPQNCDFK